MSRVKNFEATGLAPLGRLYAGDLLAIQDHYADLTNFAQVVAVGTLQVGDSSLSVVKYGSGEIRVTGAVRTDGILRGLGGIIAGAFTTTQRNAIASGFAPYGIVILNTTTNQYEWNRGTDGARDWQPFAGDLANVPTANEKAALQGTSGSPSNSNRYVTAQGLSAAIGGIITSGTAVGGDLSGTLPNPVVIRSSVNFSLSGNITPSTIGADQANYAPSGINTANTLRLASSGTFKISGITPNGLAGRILILHNIGANKIRLTDEDSDSSAVNRFALGADIALNPDDTCILHYDLTSARWRCIGVPPSVVTPPSPLVISQQDGTDNIQPAADGSAILIPFVTDRKFNITKVGYRVRVQAGNIDIAILDRAGNKIVSTGSFPCPSAPSNNLATLTTTPIDPGSYWLAMATSDNDLRWEGQHGPGIFLCREVTGVFPVPASIAPGSTNPVGVPSYVIIPS